MESEKLQAYERFLWEQEKSENTIEKYMRDIKKFHVYLAGREPTRELVLGYKESLRERYQVSSANSMLIAVNGYLRYIGQGAYCVRTFRVQRRMFLEEERELDKKEYEQLVRTAERFGNMRLAGILQTVGMTGIRIGELPYITVEALKRKIVQISFKNKIRVILLPLSLIGMLREYCRKMRIRSGSIFVTRSGKPMDRRNIWQEMKRICEAAGVQKSKVFPHNLRHLFAKCYYEKEKDIVRLADYLGHSSLETTRRYTVVSSMNACLRQLEMGLLIFEKPGEKCCRTVCRQNAEDCRHK